MTLPLNSRLRRALLATASLLLPAASPGLALAAGSAAASDATSADAASTDAAETTETVVVVGRADRPITVVPRGLAVSLGEADFQSVNALNVEDLMKYAPNFFVRKRYIGDANGVPGFRGTHSTQSARTLVMVDGFVVSNFLGNSFGFAPKWGVAGPGEVRQFDIVYGPYSARYSGHSMGGVVSITTRAPRDGEAFATGQVFAQRYRQYGTDDTYWGGTAEFGAAFAPEGLPVQVRVGYRIFENTGQPQSWFQLVPATGAPGVPVTGAVVDPGLITQTPVAVAEAAPQTTQDQLKLRADWQIGAGWEASSLVMSWRSVFDTTRPQSYLRDAAGAPVFTGRVQAQGRTWSLPAINLSLNDRAEVLAGLRLAGPVAGWQLAVNLSRFAILRGETRSSAGYANGLSGGAGTFTRQRDVGWTTLDAVAERSFGGLALAAGLQTSRYATAQDIFATTAWRSSAGRSLTSVTEGSTTLTGLFLEARQDLGEALTLSAGVRGEWWRAEDGLLGSLVAGRLATQRYGAREDDAISPKASISWDFAQGWTAQLSVATATRFPTVGELYQARLNSAGEFDPDSFDPALRPEVSRDANLMVRHSGGFGRITGSLFWQSVDDTIFSLQGFNQFGVITSSFKNVDRVRQWGVELIYEGTDVLVEGLSVDANLAWIDARTVRNRALPDSEGVQFPRIPRWRANGTLRYRFGEAWMASLGVRHASRPNTNLTGTQRGDTFGYASEQLIADLRVSYDITGALQLAVGIDNLNNDKAWAFHPFPQRTALVELRWRR